MGSWCVGILRIWEQRRHRVFEDWQIFLGKIPHQFKPHVVVLVNQYIAEPGGLPLFKAI